jgi:type IV secretory pathway TrbD component
LTALRAGGLPRGLNLLGLLVGAVGILSLMPGLTDLLTGSFGLGQTIWFVGLGMVLLRSNPDPVAYKNTTEQQLFGSKA